MAKYKQSANKTATKITLIRPPTDENQLAAPPDESSITTQNKMLADKSPAKTLIGTEIFRLFSMCSKPPNEKS